MSDWETFKAEQWQKANHILRVWFVLLLIFGFTVFYAMLVLGTRLVGPESVVPLVVAVPLATGSTWCVYQVIFGIRRR